MRQQRRATGKMFIEQSVWTRARQWETVARSGESRLPQLVLVFGARDALADPMRMSELRERYANAQVLAASTAGEISGVSVLDDTIVATAVGFAYTTVRIATSELSDRAHSRAAGSALATALRDPELAHVFAVSDGLQVNGSELVAGLSGGLPSGVMVTGGLSADGDRFKQTLVGADGAPRSGLVAAVGFYGTRLRIGTGAMGGWDTFGPDRLITRSSENVLYELDGRPALELYKRFLGSAAADLPASGLLFPLSVHAPQSTETVVRTILAIDEQDGSMTFAGDMPTGSYARLMKANFERLIDGAVDAAITSHVPINGASPDLAILVSCVGRKLVLRQRIEEEVESVREVLGERTVLAGFYAYGEISPLTPSATCALHNQSMTITTLTEI